MPSNYFKIQKSTKSFLKTTEILKVFRFFVFLFLKKGIRPKTRKENLLSKHRSKLRSPRSTPEAVHLLMIPNQVESRPQVDMFFNMANTKPNLSVAVFPKWRRNKSRDKTLNPLFKQQNPSSLPDSLCSKTKVNETKTKT